MHNVSDEIREVEEKRLAQVESEIHRQIQAVTTQAEKYKKFLRGASKDIWTEFPHEPSSFEEMVELAGGLKQIKSMAAQHSFLMRRLAQLTALVRSPYFARIDLKEMDRRRKDVGQFLSETPIQKVYIGLSSLTDAGTGEHLIYDWRAPVSSVYYDYEIGPFQYEAPSGTVNGEMLLKRHFRIKDGHIDTLFDNSLTIFDEMLLEVLSKAKGTKMRNVVNTIQREQNKVIRGEAKGALLVQGAAGSGKTIIALHRAAYLLYKYRNVITSQNIVLFSPGRVFLDYTSPVLPELGEEPIQQVTFSDLAFAINLDGTIEESGDQLEYLFEAKGSLGKKARIKAISMKSKREFADFLRHYAEKIVEDEKGPKDLCFRGKTILSNDECLHMLKEEYSYLPPKERVRKIKRRALWLLDRALEERIPEIRKEILSSKDSAFLLGSEIRRMAVARANLEVQGLRDRILSWDLPPVQDAYAELFRNKNLFQRLIQSFKEELSRKGPASDKSLSEVLRWSQDYDEVREDTLLRLSSGNIPYEDLGPILLLKGLLEGTSLTLEPLAADSEESGVFSGPSKESISGRAEEDKESQVDLWDESYKTPKAQNEKKADLWTKEIRHVIVDEVQDYSPIQHEVLKLYFPNASFTLLGDVNQCVNPHSGFNQVSELYSSCQRIYEDKGKPMAFVTLNTSYRSTKEITEFTKEILVKAGKRPDFQEAIERSGESPKVVSFPDRKSLTRALAEDVKSFQEEGYESIAIICKTARESWALYDDLKAIDKSLSKDSSDATAPHGKRKSFVQSLHLVTPRDWRFRRGVLIFPSYLAKGLEFEAVIVHNASSDNYSSEEDAHILYTACTRALHRLHVYCIGQASPFIPDSYSPQHK